MVIRKKDFFSRKVESSTVSLFCRLSKKQDSTFHYGPGERGRAAGLTNASLAVPCHRRQIVAVYEENAAHFIHTNIPISISPFDLFSK